MKRNEKKGQKTRQFQWLQAKNQAAMLASCVPD